MCCAFNDAEFSEIIKIIENKLKSRVNGAEKSSNVFTTGDDESVSDEGTQLPQNVKVHVSSTGAEIL